MWAKIITIKRTKDLNYFSLCALNLFNTRVSQFVLDYWNKLTFPQHSNLLRCTSKWALAHRWRFWTMFTFGFLFAWQSFSCICRLYSGLCSPTVVFGSIPGPYVNDRIMPMSDAVSSEGQKTTGIQQRSSALSLTHKDLSSFSETFDDVMHCRWWDL